MHGIPEPRARHLGALAFVSLMLLVIVLAALPAHSRPWKPTPSALALDYSQILHVRSGRDIILIMWIVPQMMPTVSEEARELLDKYAVIGIVHAQTLIGGTMDFDAISTLQASDSDGKVLTLLTGDNVPPAAQGALVGIQGVFQKNAGPKGQGFHWFVFEAGAVHTCETGGLSISYDGETYTYETPIPGCPGK